MEGFVDVLKYESSIVRVRDERLLVAGLGTAGDQQILGYVFVSKVMFVDSGISSISYFLLTVFTLAFLVELAR